MKQLLIDIQTTLAALGEPSNFLKYVDEDWGQLDYYSAHPPTQWPCGLIDCSQVTWTNKAGGRQMGLAQIRIRFADIKLTNTSAQAPAEQRDKAFAIFDLLKAAHAALQGLKLHDHYSGLVRLSQRRILREDGVRIYEFIYTSEIFEDVPVLVAPILKARLPE